MTKLKAKHLLRNAFFGILLLPFLACQNEENNAILAVNSPKELSEADKERQDEIIAEFLQGCALKYPVYSQERQKCLDAGLAQDPSIAYLWQQKAMPLFKQGKYEVGMDFLDEAVKYNPERWQPYRAFIKCIFAKTYRAAIEDFEACLSRYGNAYVMDHSFKFHIALSHLQLNEFQQAEAIFQEDIMEQMEKWGEAHHLDLFYYGISKYEQGKYEEAITEFDKALKLYPNFAEVQYYKAISMGKLGKQEDAYLLINKAMENGAAGNTINEDNVIYERYPYQVRWQ